MSAGETTFGSTVLRSARRALQKPHISVCICTYKRPDLLRRLLTRLDDQQAEGLFSYSLVIGDNDCLQSARSVVEAFSAASKLTVTYCVEPRQNIALMRNKVIEKASGEMIAFIDDDEFPTSDWLGNLLRTCIAHDVDGVLGPVRPYFDFDPPQWAKTGKFFERPAYKTGYRLDWRETRTGNVLFKRKILQQVNIPFMPVFDSGGEDIDFFRRMIEKGFSFAWCNEAVVYEVVPRSRCTRTYLLKRALQRGSNFPKQSRDRVRNLSKSLIAVPCYALALPILALFGQTVLLQYVIKLCDHTSRILGFLGLRLVPARQG
ncbi:MAG: glycosyltransferase [Terriglobales bacterium]